jgi:hypothetical protein
MSPSRDPACVGTQPLLSFVHIATVRPPIGVEMHCSVCPVYYGPRVGVGPVRTLPTCPSSHTHTPRPLLSMAPRSSDVSDPGDRGGTSYPAVMPHPPARCPAQPLLRTATHEGRKGGRITCCSSQGSQLDYVRAGTPFRKKLALSACPTLGSKAGTIHSSSHKLQTLTPYHAEADNEVNEPRRYMKFRR